MADLSKTSSWVACQDAKAAWQAEVAISGKGSNASQQLYAAYVQLMKTCTQEAGIEGCPW